MMATGGAFKELKQAVSLALVDTTRVAGQLANEDLAFHRSSNPSIVPLLEKQNTRLLKLARALTKAATSGTDIPAPQITDVESVDDNWRSIVDVFDDLLEKTDACLDEFTGSINRLTPGQEERIKLAAPAPGKQRLGKAYRNQNIPKPQLLFNNVPKNDETTPFQPLLRSKPHALVPLDDSLYPVDSEDGSKHYRHPYETEIKATRYPSSTFVKSDPIPYLPFEQTKATFVNNPEALATMLADLKQANEIAVDLEHHDEHSYIGLVSLMQISTRSKDWIVDTLMPWRQDLQVLNEVFANPNIIKVFHGAFMDIIWLQRDLGLYVVGLFDTFHASRALGYPKGNLAYLLKEFVDFDAAKQYQMADWRIRPLPKEMFDYARSDTHFLLYIYDNMRNELIDKSGLSQTGEDFIGNVMNKSKEEALQRYERPFYDFQRGSGWIGWYDLLCRAPTLFDREQFAVFRAVHQWRDLVARQEDESVHFVLPKHVLYNIARETPMNMPSLLACSHPMSNPFQKRKEDLLGVIKRAKITGATGPDMKELMNEINPLLDQMIRVRRDTSVRPSNDTNAVSQLIDSTERSQTALRLRSDYSRFWGSSMSTPTTMDVAAKPEDLSLALLLPQLTAEIPEVTSSSSRPAQEAAKPKSTEIADHQHIKDNPSKNDDILILKQDGGPRKRKAPISPESVERLVPGGLDVNGNEEEMDISLDQDSETERKRRKAEKKAEKKQLKRQTEEQDNSSVTKAGQATEEAAFDYANAPSVLHAKQTSAERTAAASKGVDPYAKSMNAPKGMRKSKKEMLGKSHTFKG